MTTLPDEQTSITDLLLSCKELLTRAESNASTLPEDRESFLGQNLRASLQQLELILRVAGEATDKNRDADRQSLLRRLFSKGKKEAEETIELPEFDVSSQGLHGNSWTISLPELLGFMAFGHKTGVLWIDSPSENYLVGIVEGRLMHISCDHTPEGLRLGEVLVGLGFLTRRQLERFLQTSGHQSVSGEVLLENGMIADEELREALQYQISRLFSRLVNTQQAIFRFQEGMNVELAYQVDLDMNQLLLDSARVQDEVVNPALMAASVMKEWDSWRDELGDTLGPQVESASGKHAAAQAPAAADKKAKKAAAKDAAKDTAKEPAKEPAQNAPAKEESWLDTAESPIGKPNDKQEPVTADAAGKGNSDAKPDAPANDKKS